MPAQVCARRECETGMRGEDGSDGAPDVIWITVTLQGDARRDLPRGVRDVRQKKPGSRVAGRDIPASSR